MAVYVVTGKLGNGKTLISVSKIREYLQRGSMIATNLDLNMIALCGNKTAKSPRVIRLTDKPHSNQFNSLPVANLSTDETKNGLLVLDECGTWLNARTYNDPDRQQLLSWLLMARKLGWDIILIIQDIRQIDKQIRESLAEFVVYCRRVDRMSIPFITSIFSIFGINLRLPRIHIGYVTYGSERGSPISDRWIYRGSDLFSSYNTKQLFNVESSPVAPFTYLPPFYLRHFPKTIWSFKKIMKITKIYFKKYSRILSFFVGSLFSALIISFYMNGKISDIREQLNDSIEEISSFENKKNSLPLESVSLNNYSVFDGIRITGSFKTGSRYQYFLENDYSHFSSSDLVGYQIRPRSDCEFVYKKISDPTIFGVVTCLSTRRAQTALGTERGPQSAGALKSVVSE
jgi:hypothetical protein